MNFQLGKIVETKELILEGIGERVHALCYHLVVNDEVGFDIYVDGGEKDAIAKAIAGQTYFFPRCFCGCI